MPQENLEVVKKLLKQILGPNSTSLIKDDDNIEKSSSLSYNLDLSWNEEGFDDLQIELLIIALAKLDSNNQTKLLSFGEREGRIKSRIVQQRYFGLAHGIGRSGNLTESQPKAKGSSILQMLSNKLVLQALRVTLKHIEDCLVIPVATGMSLMICMMTIRQWRCNESRSNDPRYVLWTRSDQKSAPKAIIMAGLEPVAIEGKIEGDELKTDLEALEQKIKQFGPENILCVISTTSCFAPRGVDDIPMIGMLCQKYQIGHIVNNAFGLQSNVCCDRIEQCALLTMKNDDHEVNKNDDRFQMGKKMTMSGPGIDFVVQSCDKNFLVPVGGAIIASYCKEKLKTVKELYCGRASINPNLDLFITLLNIGRGGYLKLLKEQHENFKYMKEQLKVLAKTYNERILNTKTNSISLAMTLDNISNKVPEKSITILGSMIFNANISGCRVITGNGENKLKLGSMELVGFGSHHTNYPHKYLNMAISLGMDHDTIDIFMKRLNRIIKDFLKEKQ